MLNRRSFFGRLVAAAAAAVAATEIDPERLLWVPGQKTIFIPAAPRIHKAEDVAVAKIREEFAAKSLITAETRIIRPDEFEPRVAMRDRYYDGARYTLTTRSPDGGLLQQKFDTDWTKVGAVTHHKLGGFEPLSRPASAAEVATFDRHANADLLTGRVEDEKEAFMRRFKERG